MVDDKPTGLAEPAQRDYLVNRQRMQYEGLFVIGDIYKLISEYFEEKGYDKREVKNAEIVRDDGVRYIEIIFEPWKKITDYAKSAIKVIMIMENVGAVEIEKEGLKINAHQGKILFNFSAYVETDYESRWAQKTTYNFIRILYDRYFFKRYTEQYRAECMDDFKLLVYQIRAYLNMNKM